MGLVLASKQKHFDVGLSVSARDICGDGEFGVNRGADLLDRALFPFSCVPTKIVTLIWWAAISRIAGLPEGRDKAASQPAARGVRHKSPGPSALPHSAKCSPPR